MRVATYIATGEPVVGFVRRDEKLVSLASACAAAGQPMPQVRSVLELIENWDSFAGEFAELAMAAEGGAHIDEDVAWLPPIPRPPKVMGVAANNKVAFESAAFVEDHPLFFTEPTSALVGHGQPIVIRPEYGVVHAEAELGVVIGARTTAATPESALESVFGYTIVNDVTSPDLKSGDTVVYDDPSSLASIDRADGRSVPGFEHGRMILTYHARSKGTDTFLPCGPWVTTKDEVPNPDDLAVRAYLGGELVTEDSTRNLKFSVAQVIAHISCYCTLEPGDIVHMGTAVTSSKYKLRDLDFQTWDGPSTLEIEGLGRLTNPIDRRS